MDVKSNRNASSTSRGSSGTDHLKKYLDVIASKQGARGASKKREPSCGLSKPNEAIHNPQLQPQRNGKATDKCPKPRGFFDTGEISRDEEASLEHFDEPELGSVFSPGSKKQSLNHLLNFSFAPRDNQANYPSNWAEKNKNGKWLSTRKHKYNKEQYLQANCQFIVNEKGDYKQYMSDPDALVNWNLIEQINIQAEGKPSCPICLDSPIAAKMTKCGHIYCWPCMLHYLSLSDDQWRDCPICYEPLRKDDLKSVVVVLHKTFSVNDKLIFKLMKKPKGSLIAYPANSEHQVENIVYNISHKTGANASMKLLSANTNNILDIIERESNELSKFLAENLDSPETCFIEEAIQLLEARRSEILNNQHVTKTANRILNKGTAASFKHQNNLGLSNAASAQTVKFHYFYQAEDGQHMYLHGINAKMLEYTYGSLEFGPQTLQGRIVEKEGGSMTDELRRKLRYLDHLPVTCQFEVAEIELHQPVITKDAVDYFRDQIEARKKRRQRRANEERRREKQIQVEENRKIGKYDVPELHLESRDQFPDVKESHIMFPEFSDLRQRSESESTFMTQSDNSSSPDLSSSFPSLSLDNHFMTSFSKVLTSQKQPTWPALRKSKSTGQSSFAPIRPLNANDSNMANDAKKCENSDQEDFGAVPEYKRNISDMIAVALQKGLELNNGNLPEEASISGKKKKKKNKQKLLFSTHMAIPGN
ncbi:E3 ubiquitin-protein ligase RNF10 [Euwallacea similis]|uniref:E3 ubiquitin-protein ligase RNF10 n=1 Tax=Euwallacea similis TaxID=1736056 RepID=UPI00344CD350